MNMRRALPILFALALAAVPPAEAQGLVSCKNTSQVFVTFEMERGARRASDGAVAFSYAAILRNLGAPRSVWITFTHPNAENAAQRRLVSLPGGNSGAVRVPLAIVWGPQLDSAALDRATEVLCQGS